MTGGHRQRTENDRFTISNAVYREVLHSFKYINKSSSIKYFIVSTCELFASEQLVGWLSLQQATKAQRVSRAIALPFHDLGT
jgi:hypothetical protein